MVEVPGGTKIKPDDTITLPPGRKATLNTSAVHVRAEIVVDVSDSLKVERGAQ